MRKIVFVAFCLAMGVSVAMAQSKVDRVKVIILNLFVP